MDDEEEDMSRPISQLWGTPFRDVKYEDRTTQMAAGQALAAVTAAVHTSQGHNNNSINTLPCSLRRPPRGPFHGKEGCGDMGLLSVQHWLMHMQCNLSLLVIPSLW